MTLTESSNIALAQISAAEEQSSLEQTVGNGPESASKHALPVTRPEHVSKPWAHFIAGGSDIPRFSAALLADLRCSK